MRHSILTVAGGLLLVALAGHFLSDTNADDYADRLTAKPGLHAADETELTSGGPGVERLLDRQDAATQGIPFGTTKSLASLDSAAADVHREIARDLLEPLSSDPTRVGDQRGEAPFPSPDEPVVTSTPHAEGISDPPVVPGDDADGSAPDDVSTLDMERDGTPAGQDTSPSFSSPAAPAGEHVGMTSVSSEQRGASLQTDALEEIDTEEIDTQTGALPKPMPRDESALASLTRANSPDRSSPSTSGVVAGFPEILKAQKQLARLGYDPGEVDGVPGPETRSAVRAYQASSGAKPDGVITGTLLASLDNDASAARGSSPSVTPSPPRDLVTNETAPKPRRAARSGDVAEIRNASQTQPRPQENKLKTWVAVATREIQRAIGREFNSVKNPRTMRAYCRANPETWIYDEGRSVMVLCKEVSDELSAHLNRPTPRAAVR